MVDDEWRKQRSIGLGNVTVPTAAMVGGNFQGYTYQTVSNGAPVTLPVTIYDPATGDANGFGKTAFANNTIPSARIASQSTALLKYLGTSASAPTYTCGSSSCSPNSNYSYGTSGPQNRQGLAVRGDYYQSVKSQFAFRYSSGKEDIKSTGLLGSGSKIITNYYQYMGSNTWTFTPHIVNEARLGYSHFFNSTGLLSAFTTDVVDAINIPGLKGGDPSTWGIPSMAWQAGPTGTTKPIWSGFGDQGGDGPYVVTDPTWQIVDNLSWISGKHSLRLGFEYNR